jgi:hypothetical protein
MGISVHGIVLKGAKESSLVCLDPGRVTTPLRVFGLLPARRRPETMAMLG